MPRQMRAEVLQFPPRSNSKALVASATNFQTLKAADIGPTKTVKPEQWNKLAWEFFDTIAEYRYSVEWVGNLLSRAKLVCYQDGKPTTDEEALELMGELFDGEDGQSEMLRQSGIHFTVTGDEYLCAAETSDGVDWFIAAASEVTRNEAEKQWRVGSEVFPESKIMVIRLWRPHPQKRYLADSPTRPTLPILSEIDGLTKHVAAQIDSRLASAGILWIPNDVTFGAPPADPNPGEEEEPTEELSQPDELVRTLIEAASAAMADRQSPSSLIPLVIQADGEAIKNVRFMTFWSELNAEAKNLRSEAIQRLALGMDMPPEVLTGTGDMNHWNAAQMDEAAIKAHTEPLLKVICESLTRGYLRPMMKDQEKAKTFTIQADTSGLRVRPNRSKEAIELWDRGKLKSEVMLREVGFDPDSEMMDDQEHALFLLSKIAQQTGSPELTLAALREAGVPGMEVIPTDATRVTVTEREQLDSNSPIDGQPTKQVPADGTPKIVTPASPQSSTPAPSLKGHPVARTQPDRQAARLLTAASGPLVHRALERAGNRLKSSLGGKIDGVTAAQMYQRVKIDFGRVSMDALLEDAWASVPLFAQQHGVDPVWLTAALDSYTRDLLTHQKSLDPTSLQAHLALAL